MIFLKADDQTLRKINFYNIDKEKELQKLIEKNLLEVLDIRLLVSEYVTTTGGRIDTLGIDSNNAPVIIEYKRNKNDNVINQLLSYLKWLKSQKVEFFERIVIKTFESDTSPKIDWGNPRVICIAESYNRFDTDILEFVSVKLELYTYRYYENHIFSLEKINADIKELKIKDYSETTPKIQIEEILSKVTEENNDDDYLKKQLEKVPPEIEELFWIIRKTICGLDENITVKVNTKNITFRISIRFAELHLQKESILIYFREVEHDYPANIVLPLKPGWGKINMSVRVRNQEEFYYIMPLIEKSYYDIL